MDPVYSREELIYLLSRASELEHGLACVYLYAGYSLKGDVAEGGMSADQAQMVRNWKRRLASVAVEEMLHLGQVSNMLTAIGGAPHFKRSNFPMPPLAFPFGIQLSLEPFSLETIERLVCFEMPEAGILSAEKQGVYDAMHDRVGSRRAPRLDGAPELASSEPFDIDFKTVGEFYHKIQSGFESIPEDVLFIGPPQAQANAAYIDLSGELMQVVDRASACKAIAMIIEQGESPSSDHPDAHFAVFDTIRKEYEAALAAAAKTGVPFEPVRPLIANPMTRFYDDAAGGNLITDARSHEVADLFNTVYDTMLLMLIRFFAHTEETEEELRLLARGTLRMMASVLRPMGEALAKMPAGEGYPGKNAGPGFGYNRDIHLLAHKESAWMFFLERLQDLVARCGAIIKAGGVPPELEEASAALQSVGDHLIKYLPAKFEARLDFHAHAGAGSATIAAEHDGPYLVTDLARLSNSKGEVLSTRHTVALCRCGGSNIKPYCDGTHARIGFTGEKSPDRTPDAPTSYPGKDIIVHDNRGTCCHFGNCTSKLPSVFNLRTDPLIMPDGATPGEIMQIVSECPSGALSYTYQGQRYEGEAREQEIYVSENGPYHVKGAVRLTNEAQNAAASKEHFALCRCGHSKNKPFCDGTHWYIKFKDEDN